MKIMKLIELKEKIDRLYNSGHSDDIVVVTLNQPSVGTRAFTNISAIYSGFDWEQGQIRIETEDKILSKEKDRDNVIEPIVKEYNIIDNKRSIVRKCRICENKLRIADKYCSNCGQRVKK